MSWWILPSGTPYRARRAPGGARPATEEEVALIPLYGLTRATLEALGELVEPVESGPSVTPEPSAVDGVTDAGDKAEAPAVVGKRNQGGKG